MTKGQALKELTAADHAFLSEKDAIEIAKPFGVKPWLVELADTRSKFKGLTLFGINPKTGKEYQEGDTMKGIEAHKLAIQICEHLKLEYPDFFGIGSQLRGCCAVIAGHLHNKSINEKATS